MAFNPSNNLGLPEYGVRMAIIELQDEHEVISARLIADHTNGSISTVQRAVRNLIKAGVLERVDGSTRKGGYQYAIR